VVLVLPVIGFRLASPDAFPTARNLVNILNPPSGGPADHLLIEPRTSRPSVFAVFGSRVVVGVVRVKILEGARGPHVLVADVAYGADQLLVFGA
jgi:hypothetical protein